MLQAGVVVALGKIDPLDLRPGVSLPRREEAAEKEVVEVLVIEAHEGELNAGEFSRLDVGLGRPEAEGANLLPIGVGRRAVAGAGDFHDLRHDAVFGERRCGRQG